METQNTENKYQVDTSGPVSFTLSARFMEKVEDAFDTVKDGENPFDEFTPQDFKEMKLSLALLFAEHRQARGLPLRMR